MKDFLGQELAVGDKVLLALSIGNCPGFLRGTVDSFTKCKVRVRPMYQTGVEGSIRLKDARNVVKMNWEV